MVEYLAPNFNFYLNGQAEYACRYVFASSFDGIRLLLLVCIGGIDAHTGANTRNPVRFSLAYAACGYSRSKIVYFESLTEFWNMAGHGPYVWSCYGLFFSLLGINVWLARGQRLRALKQVKAFARRNQ